ncbi:collagenase [Thalassorhabdus alkalitolerans]|uniref:Collagenase n=1 Tax=Thalassorhabdus alkalitolerans TaxID=2282697 RepID=A0ABW0YI30_9BACI
MRKEVKITSIILSGAIMAGGIFSVLPIENEQFQREFLQSSTAETFDREKEKEIKQEREKAVYGHVHIYYPEKEEEILSLTKDAFEQAMRKNEQLLGNYTKRQVDAVVLGAQEELTELAGVTDADGYYKDDEKFIGFLLHDKEAILAGEKMIVFELQSTIMHEYTHYAFRQRIKDAGIDQSEMPIWFEEGVSEYVGNDSEVESKTKILPFSQIKDKKTWDEAKKIENGDIYGQSFLAIDYLIEKYGIEIIQDIIKETKKAESFNKGFYSATGIEVEELHIILIEEYAS